MVVMSNPSVITWSVDQVTPSPNTKTIGLLTGPLLYILFLMACVERDLVMAYSHEDTNSSTTVFFFSDCPTSVRFNWLEIVCDAAVDILEASSAGS